MRFWVSTIFIFSSCVFNALNAQTIDSLLPLKLKTITGRNFNPGLVQTNKASVFIFYSPQCPICIKMTKTVRDMEDSFKLKGINFYMIYPGTYYSKASIKKFQKKYLLDVAAYMDSKSELVKILNATVTPQAFVIDKNGTVVYSGKIDNWFEDIGKRRTIITEFYLRDALNAVLENKKPPVEKTEPVGCFIN